MSTSAGMLGFFIHEASDYIEQLDGLVARASGSAPEAEPFMRAARALRGSATMAKLSGIADIAAAIERLGRSLRERAVAWDPALRGALIAAIDDLKILLHGVRTWGEAEDRRVASRLADLARYGAALRAPATPGAPGLGGGFMAAETAQIAAALDAFVARPDARDAFTLAITRVRALRGVAALKDLPPLGEVIDALDRAAKPIELGSGVPDAGRIALFGAAARVLRRASQEIASQGRPSAASPEIDAFSTAAAALDDGPATADEIVPVASLFFSDGGPHVVTGAAHPPTTPRERFRLEVVSQAEHLRRLIGDASDGPDPSGRAGRALRGAVRALQAAAESFEEHELATFLGKSADRIMLGGPGEAPRVDASTLRDLDRLAALLAAPSTPPEMLARQIAELSAPRTATPTPGTRGRQRTPTGRDLQAFLETGIAGFAPLAERPLSQPTPLVDETIVPIQALLYSGRAALDRALELRAEIGREGGTPSADTLAELFDLLELATS